MLVFFSISPLGAGESVSKPVSEIIELIDRSGLDYQVTAMGTIFEGPREKVFALLEECHAHMKKSYSRVTSKILIDDRGELSGTLKSKIDSLERHLGRKLG
ncbi:MAG: hypothetical protein Kow0074_15620 [Candidatus Zixiibacteriota bacterium]